MRSSAPPPPQSNISVFFHMQSNRGVSGTDDYETAEAETTSLSLSEDDCHCLNNPGPGAPGSQR